MPAMAHMDFIFSSFFSTPKDVVLASAAGLNDLIALSRGQKPSRRHLT